MTVPKIVYSVVGVLATVAMLGIGKHFYDARVAENALLEQKLEVLEKKAVQIRQAAIADSMDATAAKEDAVQALLERDAARKAYRTLAAREPTTVYVPVPVENGDTVVVAMVPKSEYDALKTEANSMAAKDSVALAKEQAAHAATRNELMSVRAERDNALERFNTVVATHPSTGDKLATAGKWMVVGAALTLIFTK